MGEVQHRLGEGPAPSDTVSRSEMVDLAKVLKKAWGCDWMACLNGKNVGKMKGTS